MHLFLNTRGTKGILNDVDEEIVEVLRYIETSTNERASQSDSSLVQDLNKRVQRIKESEKERKNYMTLELRDREKIEEGRKEGRKEGRIEGRKEGRIEGISIGEKQERIRIAKAFLDMADDKTIAERTGLTVDEVKEIRKEIKG